MAIIPYKTPTITKLDGRFKFYNRGFKYRISFDTRYDGYIPYRAAIQWCENAYGPECEVWNGNAHHYRKWNTNWRVVIPKNKYFRQIYLREETDVTMILLVSN